MGRLQTSCSLALFLSHRRECQSRQEAIQMRRQMQLFDTYIQKMFKREGRSGNELYTPAQTTHYLTGLAQKTIDQGQSIFFLESLRRSLLSARVQQRLV